MKRQTWTEIKARTKPEIVDRIKAEASRLSGELDIGTLETFVEERNGELRPGEAEDAA